MSARLMRLLAALPVVAVMSAAGALAASGHAPSSPACAAAAYTSRVSLVVEHGNGQVIRLCIGFDGSSITGDQVLHASGLEYGTAGYGSLGSAVCQIDNEPASYPPGCWTSSSPYWAFFVSRSGGAWTGATHGVSSETFADGDAEGFRYDPQTGGAPPPASPAGTCPTASSASPSAAATAAPAGPSVAGSPGQLSPSGPRASASPQSMPPQPAGETASPGAGVIGSSAPTAPHAGPAGASGTTAASATSGIQPGLILAAAAGGALIGLIAVRLLIRRRRT